MSATVHVYVAIHLSVAIQDAVMACLGPLREAGANATWVAPDTLGIVVRDVGVVTEALQRELAAMLRDTAAAFAPMPMTLGGIAAAPSWGRAREVRVGSTSDPKLELLHHDVEVGCMALGLEVEGRPYRPHVTIATIAEGDREVTRAIRAAARGVRVRVPMLVDTLDLMARVPSSDGSSVIRLASAPLSRSV